MSAAIFIALRAMVSASFPLSASEFADAGRHYPIVFVGDETNGFHPAALVGLEEGSNLFVSAAGEWMPGAYVPAFARRYPFALGTTPGQDGLVVYLDEAYAGFNREEGMALAEARLGTYRGYGSKRQRLHSARPKQRMLSTKHRSRRTRRRPGCWPWTRNDSG